MKRILLSLITMVTFTFYVSAQNPWLINFEDETWGPLTIHVMGMGDWDNDALHAVTETFTIVNNPDQSGINQSFKVVQFIRHGTGSNPGGAFPWGGFWASCDPQVDITAGQYVHIKFWKPMISPLKFKLEGGTSGTQEKNPMSDQTVTNGWEEIVWDFTDMTGTYPTVVLMPDFADPFTTVEDVTMYFDDILINDSPSAAFIDDPEQQGFTIYPNPAKTTVGVYNIKDANKLVVTNLLGQQVIVMENLNTNKVTLNIDDLTKGLYMISLFNGTQVTTKKFMVE
jgi:hypothetical protein